MTTRAVGGGDDDDVPTGAVEKSTRGPFSAYRVDDGLQRVGHDVSAYLYGTSGRTLGGGGGGGGERTYKRRSPSERYRNNNSTRWQVAVVISNH